jgi:hypothetical protein
MTDDENDFPCGVWIGFYIYGTGGVQHRQELNLEFKDGWLRGDGFDDIGAFLIHGSYSAETREVRWVKNYPGSHNVRYRGFREGKGIWGTWTILTARGGFKIWPKALGEGDDEVDRNEADLPAELVGVETAFFVRNGETPVATTGAEA